MKTTISVTWCVLALCLAVTAGALVFAAVPGPARPAVVLPEVFPQPCGLRPDCAANARLAAAQAPLNS
ncbi:hypothetical protein ACEN9H_23400 [Massilia cellulosiltytica]|uniref:hypothetical protein n=1 Tax=Massilia cellulosiltytica TaxID=2683234 RepID=UPI0039B44D42